MKTTPWTIEGAFGLIGEIFDELSHAYRAWKACGCGASVRETIEEDIRTYKCENDAVNKIKSTVGTIGTYDCGGQGSRARFSSDVDCSMKQEVQFVRMDNQIP